MSPSTLRHPVSILLLVSAVLVGQTSCPPQGLSLALDGGRLGDPWAMGIFGTAYAQGVLALDAVGGPVVTPIGTVCVGLSPALQLVPIALDSGGSFTLSGVLPLSTSLTDLRLFLAAAVADTAQTSGFALSNGVSVRFRPPRIYFVNQGVISPFGSTPGAMTAYDAMTDVFGVTVQFPAYVFDVARIPSRDAIAVLLANNTLRLIDDANGTTVGTITFPTSAGTPTRVVSVDDRIVVSWPGTPPSPFSGGVPGTVRVYSAATLSLLSTTTANNGNPDAMIRIPGSSFVYLRAGNTVIPFDSALGLTLPSITIGTGSGVIADWVLDNGVLYCLLGGTTGIFGGGTPAAMNAVNVATHGLVFPGPTTIATALPAQMIRVGPGAFGTSVYVYSAGAATMFRYDAATFLLQNSLAIGSGLSQMELSPGGSEWLLMCPFAGCSAPGQASLEVVSPLSFTPTVVASFAGTLQNVLVPIRSATMRKAYVVATTNTVVPFGTDPATPPGFGVTLPINANTFLTLTNE